MVIFYVFWQGSLVSQATVEPWFLSQVLRPWEQISKLLWRIAKELIIHWWDFVVKRMNNCLKGPKWSSNRRTNPNSLQWKLGTSTNLLFCIYVLDNTKEVVGKVFTRPLSQGNALLLYPIEQATWHQEVLQIILLQSNHLFHLQTSLHHCPASLTW